MTHHQITVKAKFDGRDFTVIDRSPELPALPESATLLSYLNLLSIKEWNAVSGRFDGWEVIISVEKQTENSLKTGSAYMMPMLRQTLQRQPPDSGVLTKIAPQHMQLLNQLLDAGEKEGWKKLAGPKQFAFLDELCTISIWVKPLPLH